MERTIHLARVELARRYAWENRLNRITVPTPDAWLGIMTTGKTYYDVRQALTELGLYEAALRRDGVRILQMGLIFPMEPRIVREFARGLEEVLVVEEKRPFLEMFAKDVLYGWPDRPRMVGKHDEEDRAAASRRSASSTPTPIARAIAKRLARKARLPSVEARIQHLDELKRAAPRPHPRAHRVLLLGLPAQPLHRDPRRGGGGGGHRLPRHGAWGWTAASSASRTWAARERSGSGIAPFTETPHMFQNLGRRHALPLGQARHRATRWPPASTSPTRSSTTAPSP